MKLYVYKASGAVLEGAVFFSALPNDADGQFVGTIKLPLFNDDGSEVSQEGQLELGLEV